MFYMRVDVTRSGSPGSEVGRRERDGGGGGGSMDGSLRGLGQEAAVVGELHSHSGSPGGRFHGRSPLAAHPHRPQQVRVAAGGVLAGDISLWTGL